MRAEAVGDRDACYGNSAVERSSFRVFVEFVELTLAPTIQQSGRDRFEHISAHRRTHSNPRPLALAGCMHAPRARARAHTHTLRARARTASARRPQPCPLPALPPPPITRWPTVSAHRLSCLFRCFGERLANQALGYVKTWAGAASASTGFPLPASASVIWCVRRLWSAHRLL